MKRMSDDSSTVADYKSWCVLVQNTGQHQGLTHLSDVEANPSDVLAVLFDRSPDAWLCDWMATIGERPANVGVISIGTSLRSSAATTATTPQSAGSPPMVTAIEQPDDLSTLETAIQSYLDDWTTDTSRPIIWFESLHTAIQHTSVAAMSAFLHTLQSRLEAASAIAYLLHGSEAHTERLRAALPLDENTSGAEDEQQVEPQTHEEVSRKIAALRRDDPATYTRLQAHWRAAKSALEQTELNYAKAKQLHQPLDDPDLNIQTLGWTLNGLAQLGVLDIWGADTIGPNRYDLTSYDPARLATVSTLLEADTELGRRRDRKTS